MRYHFLPKTVHLKEREDGEVGGRRREALKTTKQYEFKPPFNSYSSVTLNYPFVLLRKLAGIQGPQKKAALRFFSPLLIVVCVYTYVFMSVHM